MKKLLWGTLLLTAIIAVPVPSLARVNIGVSFPLPPPIMFPAPPEVIVLPDTPDVYVVPDVDAELFFWDGWWWRFWDGRWYRSHYYDRGWGYYRNVPSFYFDVDPGWRGYYRDRNWNGHRWNYERIPHQRFQKNWRSWKNDRRWERRGTWGVQDYKSTPRPQRRELRQDRERQYRQRLEDNKRGQTRERTKEGSHDGVEHQRDRSDEHDRQDRRDSGEQRHRGD